MKRPRGFTLIELLVVIAIIAILAAILFPVFAQAREKARQITCASNMKELALAFLMYDEDYDETYPMAFNDGIGAGLPGARWQTCILPYIKSNGVFGCPDDAAGQSDPLNPGQVGCSYAVNSFFSYYNEGPLTVGPIGLNSGYDPSQFANTEAEMTQPAGTILLCEVWNADAEKAPCTAGNDIYCSNDINFGQSGIITGGSFAGDGLYIPWGGVGNNPNLMNGTYASPSSTGFNDTALTGNELDGSVSVHPSGFSNFAFLDGHVKAMKPEATDPNSWQNTWSADQGNMWNGRR